MVCNSVGESVMCYNLIVINTDKKEKKRVGELLSYIFESFRYNHDGAFLFNSTNNQYVRTLDYEEFKRVLSNQVLGNGYIHMHLRLASHGSVNVDNIHGWQFDNYYCSHNGSYFEGYTYYGLHYGYDNNNNTDSFQFFNKYKNEINKNKLSKIDLTGFFGVAFCTPKDNTNKRIVMISKNKSIKVYKFGSLLLFSNEPLDFLYSPLKFAGFEFNNVIKTEIENQIIVYDYKQLNIIKHKDVNVKSMYGMSTINDPFYDVIYKKSHKKGSKKGNKVDNDALNDTWDFDNYHYKCTQQNGELDCSWEMDDY